MSQEQDDDSIPPDMFPAVWVKIEIDEDGVVNGIDSDNQESTDPIRNSHKLNKDKCPPSQPTFFCDYCDYKTSFKNALKFHIMKHTNPGPLTCYECSYTTRYPCSLRRHILGQHKIKNGQADGVPTFECTECEYTTIFKSNLEAHKRKHASNKKYKCDHCTFSTAYRHSFLKHCKTHEIKNTSMIYQCDKCSFSTKYEGHIARHLAQIHKVVSNKALQCDQCQFSTTVKWRLNIHKNRSRQQVKMQCKMCDYATEYRCNFKMHKNSHIIKPRVTDTNVFTPNIDSVPQNESDEFMKELDKLITSEKRTESYVPTKVGNTQYLVDTEIKDVDWKGIEVKENPGCEKPFECSRCQYTSKFKAAVQRHYQRHHTGQHSKPYKCMHCDFSTKTKDQISLHNKRSVSNELLTCKQCNFTTTFKCQNVMHQRVHYRFKCKFCSYTCKTNYEIQRHYVEKHVESKKKCQYCDYTAMNEDSIICHESSHTGQKPFHCNFCDYATVRQIILQNHIRKYHPDQCMVTVIDYSKIKSLKTESTDNNEKDIVEINPLFQSDCNK